MLVSSFQFLHQSAMTLTTLTKDCRWQPILNEWPRLANTLQAVAGPCCRYNTASTRESGYHGVSFWCRGLRFIHARKRLISDFPPNQDCSKSWCWPDFCPGRHHAGGAHNGFPAGPSTHSTATRATHAGANRTGTADQGSPRVALRIAPNLCFS